MARPRQKNIVERLTGAGEEAIQRIGGAPGADKVIAALGSLPKRVDELQRSVRKGSSSSRKTSSAKRSTAARKRSSSSS